MAFKYKDNGLKSAYNNAQSYYNKLYSNPTKYGANKYKSQVDALFDDVMNYGDFSYDMEKDQLFQMYKQQYQRKGIAAMQNQMGVAAANSGGYNSSYAQTSAQDTYQTYMDELSQKASETYQNAYDLYNQDYNNLLNRYNVASDMNNASNEAYYNKLNQASNKATNTYGAYQDDRQLQYQQYSDNLAYQQTQKKNEQDQKNWEKEYKLRKKMYTS